MDGGLGEKVTSVFVHKSNEEASALAKQAVQNHAYLYQTTSFYAQVGRWVGDGAV